LKLYLLAAYVKRTENLKKPGGHRIRLGAGGPSVNPIIPEITCFQKLFTLRFKRPEKNREKVKREIQQWMCCIIAKEQFDLCFMIKALIFSQQGFNMFQARSVLGPHIVFYKC